MPHAHHHEHSHAAPDTFGRVFLIGILLNSLFVSVEILYGLQAQSLALLADAGHNLSDVLGLILAWLGLHLASRAPSMRRTYGLRRASILGALANGLFLLISVGGIAWESILRFAHPQAVAGHTVMWIAGLGIVINSLTAYLFARNQQHNELNMRAAFLHLAADAAISAGVVLAGWLILHTGLRWIDPLISLVIAGIILWGTWGVLRNALNLALDAVPTQIDIQAVQTYLEQLEGIQLAYHLHIWALSTEETALTVNLVQKEATLNRDLLAQIQKYLTQHFNISHSTIQFELANPHNHYHHDCIKH
jgi:cobalt-zinc-cadmium efflux system protein